MMSRRASFDIFQGNATLFLFRDAFAPHRRDPACTDELAAPAPASEPEISPDGDPYECRTFVSSKLKAYLTTL